MTILTGLCGAALSTNVATAGRQLIAWSVRNAGWFERGGGELSVVEALERELQAMPDLVADSTLAAGALAIARELDADNSATSKSMCMKALADTMRKLRELAPPVKVEDELDVQRSRRAKRLAGSAAPANQSGS